MILESKRFRLNLLLRSEKCGREQLDLSFKVLQLLMYMLLQLFKSSHQAIFLRLSSLKK